MERYLACSRRLALLAVTAFALVLCAAPAFGSEPGPGLSPDEALTRIMDGNVRFASGKCEYPDATAGRRVETAQAGQHPFVTVLACSDSRCPVERLFDQGIGNVFVVRVAGNVCAVDEIGSIEYGVGHLQTPLLVVLGHTQCGAVTAVTTEAELHGNIPALVEPIKPALATAQKKFPNLTGKELVPAATEANVWQAIDDLFRSSAELREKATEGAVKVVGAIYHIETGRIDWLGAHPEQDRLLKDADQGETHESQPDVAVAPAETPVTAQSEDTPPAEPAEPPSCGLNGQQALLRLQEGHARYLAGTATHPDISAERLAETATDGQHPFATIVGCSDSRVPLELLFDQGVGDLFVVRVAGNVCNTDEIGSVEYGVGHLGSPLLVVLGHTKCGAVTAVATSAELHGSIAKLVAPIQPAVAAAKQANPGMDGNALVPAAVRANVLQAIQDLQSRSAEVRELVRSGRLTIRGAVYNIETGVVDWLRP